MSYGLYAITQYLVYSVDHELKQIAENLPHMDSNTRKQTLHSHFYKTREKFLRLLTLVRWTQRHKRSFNRFEDIIFEMEIKGNGMLNTTNKLFDVDKKLRIARYILFYFM
jgi:hypothetical protein